MIDRTGHPAVREIDLYRRKAKAREDAATIKAGDTTHASVETINRAAEIRLRAERRLGELLLETPKRSGESYKGGGSSGSKREPLPDAPPTLAESGISKKLSSRAQELAAAPVDTRAAVPVYILSLTPTPDPRDPQGIHRLRRCLKWILRAHGLRCLRVAPAPPRLTTTNAGDADGPADHPPSNAAETRRHGTLKITIDKWQ